MNSLRLRGIIVGLIVACSTSNCGEGTEQGSSGAGGEGQGSSGSSSASSSSSSTTSSGGMTKCDTQATSCAGCVECSRKSADGLCVTKYNNCLDSQACYAYAMCVATCIDGDAACKSLCEDHNPTGVPIYDVYVTCVVCQDCYLICDGASACM